MSRRSMGAARRWQFQKRSPVIKTLIARIVTGCVDLCPRCPEHPLLLQCSIRLRLTSRPEGHRDMIPPDPICRVCGVRQISFILLEFYLLPWKLKRKRHKDREWSRLYCTACWEALPEIA